MAHKILSVTGLIKVLGQISVACSGGKKGGKIAAHPRGGPAGLVTRQASSSQPLRRLTAKSLTFLEPSGKEHAHGQLPARRSCSYLGCTTSNHRLLRDTWTRRQGQAVRGGRRGTGHPPASGAPPPLPGAPAAASSGSPAGSEPHQAWRLVQKEGQAQAACIPQSYACPTFVFILLDPGVTLNLPDGLSGHLSGVYLTVRPCALGSSWGPAPTAKPFLSAHLEPCWLHQLLL